jgi:hypothetical protein
MHTWIGALSTRTAAAPELSWASARSARHDTPGTSTGPTAPARNGIQYLTTTPLSAELTRVVSMSVGVSKHQEKPISQP